MLQNKVKCTVSPELSSVVTLPSLYHLEYVGQILCCHLNANQSCMENIFKAGEQVMALSSQSLLDILTKSIEILD